MSVFSTVDFSDLFKLTRTSCGPLFKRKDHSILCAIFGSDCQKKFFSTFLAVFPKFGVEDQNTVKGTHSPEPTWFQSVGAQNFTH